MSDKLDKYGMKPDEKEAKPVSLTVVEVARMIIITGMLEAETCGENNPTKADLLVYAERTMDRLESLTSEDKTNILHSINRRIKE